MAARGTRGQEVSRRKFFEWGVWLVAGVFSFLLGLPLVGYVGYTLFRREPEQWVAVCPLDQIGTDTPVQFRVAFKRESASQGYEDVRGVLVIRKGSQVMAFSNICTHMGCSVRWIAWREQILCPCHGGTYDRWGNLAGGPPAYSLPLFVSKIEDNTLYVADRLERR